MSVWSACLGQSHRLAESDPEIEICSSDNSHPFIQSIPLEGILLFVGANLTRSFCLALLTLQVL